MKTILLTGARGMVGGAVLRQFHGLGWRVIVACSGRVKSASSNIDVVPFDLASVAGNADLEAAMAATTVVVHCAALLPSSGLLRTAGGSRQLYSLNAVGTYDLMEMAARHNVRNFVYVSTANLYGPDTSMIEESIRPTPTDAYMLSKLACEEAASMFGRTTKTVFTGLRVSAPYGAGFNVKAVIPIFVQRALDGNTLELQGSGQRQQVFTYVGDIARACLSAISSTTSNVCNIAGPGPVSMIELAQAAIRAVDGSTSVIAFSGQADPNEGSRRQVSIARALQILGWSPAYDLDRGLKAMVDDMRNPPPPLLQDIAA